MLEKIKIKIKISLRSFWKICRSLLLTSAKEGRAEAPEEDTRDSRKVVEELTMSFRFRLTKKALLRGLTVLVSVVLTVTLFDATLFSFHPVCMCLSYVLLMTEAVQTALSFRDVVAGDERVKGITRHMVLNLGALVCAVVGFAAIYKNKVRK